VRDAPAWRRGEPEAPPPILGRWRNLYLLVLGELAALVGLFYALARWAS
jgi:hypothetical protein